MKEMIDSVLKYLPTRLAIAINSLSENVFDGISEIRLRKNLPISITANRKNITIDEKGKICKLERALRVSEGELAECIKRLTEYSRYKYDEYIERGFIPLPEGGRVGVCGAANPSGGFSEILSLNIRVCRFLPNVASGLISHYCEKGVSGTLVCAPPALGKTTFLRSAAFLLSSGRGIEAKRVGLADERLELSAGLLNCGLIDIISSMPKSKAIEILTRTMSPEIIICDEIGVNECDLLLETQNSGVTLIASAHSDDIKTIKNGRLKRLFDFGVFKTCVLLSYDNGYKSEIIEAEAIF